jgi:hypothetical protein
MFVSVLREVCLRILTVCRVVQFAIHNSSFFILPFIHASLSCYGREEKGKKSNFGDILVGILENYLIERIFCSTLEGNIQLYDLI